MNRAELIDALPNIGWTWVPASPKNADGTHHYMRLVNQHGKKTQFLANSERLMVETDNTASCDFIFDKCSLDIQDGCISVYCDQAFVNLYNHRI